MSTKRVEIQKYNFKIKSKVHKEIYHTAYVDLMCHEKMPSENQILTQTKIVKKKKKKRICKWKGRNVSKEKIK